MISQGIRDAFMELNGGDVPGAKFEIGQVVQFKKKFCEGSIFGAREEVFVGAVQAINCTGDGIEYLIESAPVLAWENELEST